MPPDPLSGRAWSLRSHLLIGLLAYLVLLTVGVLANDYIVNEGAENLVWSTLLDAEMTHFLERRGEDSAYRWEPTETLELFEFAAGDARHPDLVHLPAGVHDEIMVNGSERVVLVHDQGEKRFALALDISAIESREAKFRTTVFASAVGSVLLLGLLAAWGVNRLTRPLRLLASQIRGLDPEGAHKRVDVPRDASAEVILIAEAMNTYSSDLERYIAREREFIATASHELRTPLTVIGGAVDLAAQDPSVSVPVQSRLSRAQRTIEDVQELIALLLVLARNPEKLNEASEPIELDQLIAEIADEHRSLASGKGLDIAVGTLIPSTIVAPLPMVRIAIANLVRNAIEATHTGTVTVGMDRPDGVVIENPTPNAPPAQLAALYTRLARGSGTDGGGIGLPLIAKLSRHCGWDLLISDAQSSGVRFALSFVRTTEPLPTTNATPSSRSTPNAPSKTPD